MEAPEDFNIDLFETNSLLTGSFLSTTLFQEKRENSGENRPDALSYSLNSSLLQLVNQPDPSTEREAFNEKSQSGFYDTKESNLRYMPLI